jgi:hypothetical protein
MENNSEISFLQHFLCHFQYKKPNSQSGIWFNTPFCNPLQSIYSRLFIFITVHRFCFVISPSYSKTEQ